MTNANISSQFYKAGYNDAIHGGSKVIRHPDYDKGYEDGTTARVKNELVESLSRGPAYYEAEGGSMCNGIGRSYF